MKYALEGGIHSVCALELFSEFTVSSLAVHVRKMSATFYKIKNGFSAVASWPFICCYELQINEKINQGKFPKHRLFQAHSESQKVTFIISQGLRLAHHTQICEMGKRRYKE